MYCICNPRKEIERVITKSKEYIECLLGQLKERGGTDSNRNLTVMVQIVWCF